MLLAARTTLHEFLRRMTWEELRSGLLLLAMTFLLLPVLPREPVDPWGVLIPYEVWLMVILIAVVSFAGYAAVRIMGERRGLALAAAAGALVSSTAVTLNNSRLASLRASSGPVLSSAICIAWAVSLTRMTTIACVINRGLIPFLGLPIIAAVLALLAASWIFSRNQTASSKTDGLGLRNPFELTTVLFFGGALALVLPAAKFVSDYFGASGLMALAALSGLVDVDPIMLSVSRLAGDGIAVPNAALAILTAAAANMIGKTIIALSVGGVRFGLPLAVSGTSALFFGFTLWFAAQWVAG
jgi:uncharacterized membrane protein (DUF4010 family)